MSSLRSRLLQGEVGVVEAFMERAALVDSVPSEAGDRYAAVWDPDSPGAISLIDLASEKSVYQYDTGDSLRYVGQVAFDGDTAVLADVLAIDQDQGAGSSQLIHVDLAAGESTAVPAPAGTKWTMWPGQLIETDRGFAWTVRQLDDSGDCIATIEPGVNERVEARTHRCWPGKYISFTSASTGGLSALMFPAGENITDCRQRVYVTWDGAEHLVGGDDTCQPYDGVVLDGWHIWTRADPDDPYQLPKSALLANGPDGHEHAFGWVVTGTLTKCGDHVFWYAEEAAPTDPDGAVHFLRRWAPGMRAAETIDTDRPGDYRSGGVRCSGSTVTTQELNYVSTPASQSTYYFPSS